MEKEAHLPIEWLADAGERKGLPGEKAKKENQRQGNVELQKKGSSLLFMEVMTPGLIPLELSQTPLRGVSRP